MDSYSFSGTVLFMFIYNTEKKCMVRNSSELLEENNFSVNITPLKGKCNLSDVPMLVVIGTCSYV